MADLDYGVRFDLNQNNQNHAADVNRYLGGYNRGVDSHPYIKGCLLYTSPSPRDS